eukprot:m.128406 g.128406  ORF g.128406 m.128406 type:complete len:788 (-) comp15826_c0_seq4:218-2581(-)
MDPVPSSSPAKSNRPEASSSPLPYAQSEIRGSEPSTSPFKGPASAVPTSSPISYAARTPRTPLSTTSRAHSDAGTPRRRELGDGNQRQFDPSSAGNHEESNASETSRGNAGRTVIWGTNVNIEDSTARARRFLRDFSDEEGLEPRYQRLIKQMADTSEWHVDMDCSHLKLHDPELYRQLVRYPQEVIPILDRALADVYADLTDEPMQHQAQLRPYNLDGGKTMRDLNPEDVDQLISIRGMVIRISSVIPEPSIGFFRCSTCHFEQEVGITRGRIMEPETCSNCQTKKSFALVHNRCTFTDKQMVKLQETPDKVPDGQTPQTVLAYCFDALVDTVQPGDLIEITAIYRATPLRINPRMRTVKAVFKTHLDVIHFQRQARNRVGKDEADDENEDEVLIQKREQELRELSQAPDIYDKLVQAIAPSIYGYDEVKRGILAMLFGGTHKTFTQAARGKFRGEINVLLCGDPGTSKSQLLQYAVKLAPRGMYTSGKGSSAVGLTAYVTKDPETKQIVLESGALVLCDGGICCIDEFDKMSDSTRSILHEVMEQQTVSIAKAGIIATLNARTSVLAAANPQDSSWNERLSIVDNIQLPPTLLSRFDLIYLILDRPDRQKDEQLARHIVALYFKDRQRQDAAPGGITKERLAQYISYTHKNIKLKLTEEAWHGRGCAVEHFFRVIPCNLVTFTIQHRSIGYQSSDLVYHLTSLPFLPAAVTAIALLEGPLRIEVLSELLRLIDEHAAGSAELQQQHAVLLEPVVGRKRQSVLGQQVEQADRNDHAYSYSELADCQ